MHDRLRIVFKSGTMLDVDAVPGSLEWTNHRTTGALTRLHWTTPDNATTQLLDVQLSEVVALVRLRYETGEDVVPLPGEKAIGGDDG